MTRGSLLVGLSLLSANAFAQGPAPRTRSDGGPSVASFPDVEQRSTPRGQDPTDLEDPYQAELSAALAHRNLYGDELDDPYAEDLKVAATYATRVAIEADSLMNPPAPAQAPSFMAAPQVPSRQPLKDPYGRGAAPAATGPALKSPYADAVPAAARPYAGAATLKDPYAADVAERAPTAPPPTYYPAPPAPVPGSVQIDPGPSFRGTLYLDGIGVPPTASPLVVFPGRHALDVFPANGPPYRVWIDVRPGGFERLFL